jgi:hypothetical protein
VREIGCGGIMFRESRRGERSGGRTEKGEGRGESGGYVLFRVEN